MRKIIYRGRDKNGIWHEGSYVCLNSAHHRIYMGYPDPKAEYIYPDWYSVDPETVGQYTGLKDKNDQKIFEGDILKFGAYNVQVYWNDETFSWEATKCENKYDGYRHFQGKPEEWDDIYLGWIAAEIPITGQMTTEIIGNIYDNPELIEKKEHIIYDLF